MRDDAPPPPTLAQVQVHTEGVFCWCNRRSHHAVLPVAVLIAHCGPALPFPMIHGRLRCQACGSKDIHARPNWKGLGQVAGHGPSTYQEKAPDDAEPATLPIAVEPKITY